MLSSMYERVYGQLKTKERRGETPSEVALDILLQLGMLWRDLQITLEALQFGSVCDTFSN